MPYTALHHEIAELMRRHATGTDQDVRDDLEGMVRCYSSRCLLVHAQIEYRARLKAALESFGMGDDGEIPEEEDYRLFGVPDRSRCLGRIDGGVDSRWSVAVYIEDQCKKEATEGYDLCKVCARREGKYNSQPGAWLGRVTEEPLAWWHALGTAWFHFKRPTFLGQQPQPARD